MRLFACQNCGQLLFFENTRCERCGYALGFLPEKAMLSALNAEGGDRWRPLNSADGLFRYCANATYHACNWLVPADGPDYCRACRLNRTVPDLSDPGHVLLWQRIEAAKHRLVYSLLRLDLPVVSKFNDAARGLAFDFLSDDGGARPVTTGHADGLITLDLAEADTVERERNRRDMLEPYRTLLGHFRHEIGHYYWDRLVKGGVWHDAFRELFGDERQDYAAALEAHYARGPTAIAMWQDHHISSYAASHPWEDFAESWAHYLHIVDTLDTAHAFGLEVRPELGRSEVLEMAIATDPYRENDFDLLMTAWPPLTYALNSLNQSMGQPDLYPFVLAPAVMGKLRFIHGLIHGVRSIR